MNFSKKFLILVMLFLILLSGCSSGSSFNDDGLTFEYNDYLEVLEDKFYFKQLNDNQKKIYMCLYDASINFETSFEYQFPFVEEDHNAAYQAFICDWPEYFWWTSLDNTTTEQFGKTTVKSVSEYLYTDSIQDYYNEMTGLIDGVINSISGDNDYDKIKSLHDYMIDNYEYNNDFFVNIDDDTYYSNDTIYKLLKDGVGTNFSYGLLFSTLASKLGYECHYVIPNNDSLCHNMIKINDNYYYIDVATDDYFSESTDFVSDKYLYFLATDDIELPRHINDKTYSHPSCSNDEYYMSDIPGKFFEEYDEKAIKNFIVDHFKNENNEILLVFDNTEDAKKIYDYLFEDFGAGFTDLYRKRINSNSGISYTYYMDDYYNYVIFTYKVQ